VPHIAAAHSFDVNRPLFPGTEYIIGVTYRRPVNIVGIRNVLFPEDVMHFRCLASWLVAEMPYHDWKI